MEFVGYDLMLSFLTLTFLEIILGIDNLIFISLVTQKLPHHVRNRTRIFGLSLALVIRVGMLMALSWVMSLNDPLFYLGDMGFSFRNFLLLAGGIFLIIKSGREIYIDVYLPHENHSHDKSSDTKKTANKNMLAAIFQIVVIDFIFSFDSVITAVAMTNNIPVIVAAVIISMIIMLFSSETISRFLTLYPSLKIVALAFIFLIGVILLADSINMPISKTYLYFALFFTLTVEVLNIIARKRIKTNIN